MTLKRRIIIDVECSSSCSEADLYSHVQNIAQAIICQAKAQGEHSWNKAINVSWVESFPVQNTITLISNNEID